MAKKRIGLVELQISAAGLTQIIAKELARQRAKLAAAQTQHSSAMGVGSSFDGSPVKMPPVSTADTLIGQRYVLQEKIGSGGMGTVFLARDRLTEQDVALKRVITPANFINGDSVYRSGEKARLLTNEFRVLSSIRHQNIVHVLDYGFDADFTPYYTMELLKDALTIVDYARQQPRSAQIALLIEMLQALTYLHGCRIIHRDLKPANVLVYDGEVKLLDFGLAIQVDHDMSSAGTTKYMAPELLRQDKRQKASVSSDLYAIGLIAYEIFVGHYPFAYRQPEELLNAIYYETPTFTDNSLDPQLRQVVLRLLAKSPDARYETALEVIDAISKVTNLSYAVEFAPTRESIIQAAPFVGRGQELETLNDALSQAHAGIGSAWLIGGESGVGKTRICKELAISAQIAGATLLRGQAVREGGAAFQLWHTALQRLALGMLPSDPDAAMMKLILPEIERLVGYAIPDAPQFNMGRFVNLLTNLIRQQDCTVIILEDIHWADEPSLTLLNQLSTLAKQLRLLIVASFRNDERPDLPQTLAAMHSLQLRRLTHDEVAQLSNLMLYEIGRNAQIIDTLYKQTEGNAFFVVEVVRALSNIAGGLAQIRSNHFAQSIFTQGINSIIHRKLDQIRGKDRELLELVAIAGRTIDPKLLPIYSKKLECDNSLEAWLGECLQFSILEAIEDRWSFAHDKLRESLLATISVAQTANYHGFAAAAIESTYGESAVYATALAHHWRMAGNSAQEKSYVLSAAEQSWKMTSYREATAFYERALMLYEESDAPSTKLQCATIALSLGRTYRYMRRYQEADDIFQNWLPVFTELGTDVDVARVWRELGALALDRGLYAQAVLHYQQCAEVFRQAGLDVETAEVNSALGRAFEYGNSNYEEAVAYYKSAYDLFTRLGDSRLRGIALNDLGNASLKQGLYPKAKLYFRQAFDIFEEHNHVLVKWMALFNLGIVSEKMGEFDEAEKMLQEIHRVDQEQGADDGTTLHKLGLVAYGRGELKQALRYFEDSLDKLDVIGMQQGVAELSHCVGKVLVDLNRIDEAQTYCMRSIEIYQRLGDRLGVAATLSSLTIIMIAKNDLITAYEYLLEGFDLALQISTHPIILEITFSAAKYFHAIGRSTESLQLCYLCYAHPSSYETLRRHATKMAQLMEKTLTADQSKMRIPKNLNVFGHKLLNKLRQSR